ncbi:MAG TPA: hypothetical protein VM364_01090 [Vicinamibacterales bacterium]|nr:hypothetical protein [Vicinamibacterales bacterium]
MNQITEARLEQSGAILWWVALAAVLVAAVLVLFFWHKGRRIPGDHVFRASRLSRGNLLFPTQVAVSPGSVLHYTPEVVGGREQSIHIAHISSVLIDRNLFFSDVMIETSGGASPIRCHGHRKRDAIAMKQLIEKYQSEYYARPAGRRGADGAPRAQPPDGEA